MVWFQGIQSSTSSGLSVADWRDWRDWATLAHIMRWVLITALGRPVDPEVNNSLPTVSGVICATDAATADVAGVRASASKARLGRPSGARSTCTTGMPDKSSAFRAFWNCMPSCTITSAGCTSPNRYLSLAWSWLSSA